LGRIASERRLLVRHRAEGRGEPASLDSLRDRANFGVALELGAQKMLSARLPTTTGWLWGVCHSERGEAATPEDFRGEARLSISDYPILAAH